MKKYFILVLCAFLSVGLVTGCGSKKEEKKEEIQNNKLNLKTSASDCGVEDRSCEYNIMAEGESYKKGEEFVLNMTKDVDIDDPMVQIANQYIDEKKFYGAAVYSNDGKFKNFVTENDNYIVEDDNDIFYRISEEFGIGLIGNINLNDENKEYYLNIYLKIVDGNKLFKNINLNDAERTIFGGIGGYTLFEGTFKEFLDEHMNEYIDLYVNQYNVKVSNLKDNSKFRLYVTDELNKEINDKYGIKVDRIDISFK